MRAATKSSGLHQRAFTITEMLVTLAIIALLAGVLLPALSGVKRAARSTECQGHLRQMAIAAQHYVAIHDRWPAAITYENTGGQMRQVAWDWVTGFFDGTVVEPGPLWTFTDDPGAVMQCPEYHGSTNFDDPFTGYNYNTTYIGDEEEFSITGAGLVRAGVRPAACRRSSLCALFGDGGRAGGTSKFMRAPLNSVEDDLGSVYAGGQAFRHSHATNLAFVDGHVGSTQESHRGELATEQLLNDIMGWPSNGFLSNDDSMYDPR